MSIRERWCWAITCLGLLATHLFPLPRRPDAPGTASRLRPTPGIRITMAALHQQGGVPSGWSFAPPPGDATAGQQAFEDLGCSSCHLVRNASVPLATPSGPGPELTGMGGHHPVAYFAEAILNPDAVLVDGPGFLGPDGHSTMPSYPDLTAGQLSDLIAYLASLRNQGPPSCHSPTAAVDLTLWTPPEAPDRPRPAEPAARRHFSQSYEIQPGQRPAFEAWFAATARPHFLESDGLMNVETFVDVSRPMHTVTTVLSFRDETALRNFMGDPASTEIWRQFDSFISAHGHLVTDHPPIYRAPSLGADPSAQ